MKRAFMLELHELESLSRGNPFVLDVGGGEQIILGITLAAAKINAAARRNHKGGTSQKRVAPQTWSRVPKSGVSQCSKCKFRARTFRDMIMHHRAKHAKRRKR